MEQQYKFGVRWAQWDNVEDHKNGFFHIWKSIFGKDKVQLMEELGIAEGNHDDLVLVYEIDEEIWGLEEYPNLFSDRSKIYSEDYYGTDLYIGILEIRYTKQGLYPVLAQECASPTGLYMSKKTLEHILMNKERM